MPGTDRGPLSLSLKRVLGARHVLCDLGVTFAEQCLAPSLVSGGEDRPVGAWHRLLAHCLFR